MRKLLCVMAVLSITATATALPVVNGDWGTGDETGWTQARYASWGAGEQWGVSAGDGNPAPSGELVSTNKGSFGWYQRVPTNPSEFYTLVADWSCPTGLPSNAGWAEIGALVCTEGMTDGDIVAAIDGGQGIVAKKDGWGLNNGQNPWGWEPISASLVGDQEIHSTCAEMVVFVKLGTNPGQATLLVDNIELVPEPTAALLLGLPILFLRRRR